MTIHLVREAGGPRKGDTMHSTIDRYIRHRRAVDNISPKSARDFRSRLAGFPDVELRKIQRRHVVAWLDSISHLSTATRHAYFSTLRRFFRWAVDEDLIAKDPTRGLRGPKVIASPPRHLTRDEATALVQAAATDLRTLLIVILMLQLGLRRGEVAAIRLEDIDPAARVLHVRGKGGQGAVTRVVAITDEAWSVLSRYRTSLPRTGSWGRHGPLLRSRLDPTVGIAPARVSELVSAAMIEAGVKVPGDPTRTPHSCRHSSAVDMLEASGDLRGVQHVLGHASIRTSEHYVRGAALDLRPVMEGRSYLHAA